jgi:hypothetical protein
LNYQPTRIDMEEKDIMTESEQPVASVKSKPRFRINYQWVVRNVPYFLFLSVLTVMYIYNGHQYDKTIKEVSRTNRQLKELQYEYKTLKSEVMFRSKQSELVKAVMPLGLEEMLEAPVVLMDSTPVK